METRCWLRPKWKKVGTIRFTDGSAVGDEGKEEVSGWGNCIYRVEKTGEEQVELGRLERELRVWLGYIMFEMLRVLERDVKLVITIYKLEPIQYIVDQHILMVFKDMLEELHILAIEEGNVRRQDRERMWKGNHNV